MHDVQSCLQTCYRDKALWDKLIHKCDLEVTLARMMHFCRLTPKMKRCSSLRVLKWGCLYHIWSSITPIRTVSVLSSFLGTDKLQLGWTGRQHFTWLHTSLLGALKSCLNYHLFLCKITPNKLWYNSVTKQRHSYGWWLLYCVLS